MVDLSKLAKNHLNFSLFKMIILYSYKSSFYIPMETPIMLLDEEVCTLNDVA
jgi:hypothetical protein